MGWLKTSVKEIFGLFVDDGALAVAILLWLVAVWVALPRIHMAPAWRGPILGAGLVLILIESATRYARHRSP